MFNLFSVRKPVIFDDRGELSGGRWVTIEHQHVYIKNGAVEAGHIPAAAAKMGLSNQAHGALKSAHEAGQIKTQSDLYGVIGQAKKLQNGGLNEKQAYSTALALHTATGGASSASALSDVPAHGISEMRVSDLRTDPERFQYKVNVGAKGTNSELHNVTKWNENLAGVQLAWHDPQDGKSYIINGHHRHELATRLGVESVPVRHIEASNAAEARYIGAVANIAEGRGTAIDAAKLLRDNNVTPEKLAADGVSLKGKVAADGAALSRLPEALWGKVYRGEVSTARGVAIGASGLQDHEMQLLHETVAKHESKGKKLSDGEVSELAAHVKSAGETTQTTSNLFGDEEVKHNLFIEKAQLSSYLKQKLGQDKKLFGFVSKGNRAEKLAEGGNTINVSESQKIADQSAKMEEIVNRLAHRSGPVADALHSGATKLAQGENLNDVRTELYERVHRAVAELLAPGSHHAGPPAGGEPDQERDNSPGMFREALVDGTGGRDRKMRIEFNLDAASSEGAAFVVRPGKVFEAGAYPDKNFSLSAAEMESAVQRFHAAQPVGFEHSPSPLDGFIGDVQRVWHDGKNLYADVALNKHIDAIYRENNLPVKVSAEWDRESKTLVGLALVRNPRVSDAALMSAFSATFAAESENIKRNEAQFKGAAKGNPMLEKLFAKLKGKGVLSDADIAEFTAEEAKETTPAKPAAPAAPASFAETPEYRALFATITTQQTQMTELLATFAAEKKTAQFASDNAAIDALVRQMKLSPATAETYRTMAKDEPAKFAAVLPLLKDAPVNRAIAADRLKVPATAGTGDAGQQLSALTANFAKENNCSVGDAMKAVLRANPALAAEHHASAPGALKVGE